MLMRELYRNNSRSVLLGALRKERTFLSQGEAHMKTIKDPEMKISISNKKISYDRSADVITPSKTSPTKNRKYGYLVYDERGKGVGLVFMSDDKRTARYGDCEILFFKEYEREYGSRRVVKMYGERFPFSTLEKIMSAKESHSLVIDSRTRKISE